MEKKLYVYTGHLAKVYCEAIGRFVKKGEEVELPAHAVSAVWQEVGQKKATKKKEG